MRQRVLNTFFLLLFLPICFLFGSGSWDGEVILSEDAVPINTSITATIINLNYTPTDPTAIQELEDGKATIEYEYCWTFSAGGIIESGQTSYCCTGKFSTISSSVGDKTVKVEVTAKVIYTESGQVVDTDSHNFSANLTVFKIEIKAEDGTSDPDPYIPARGSKTYRAVLTPSGLSGSYEWNKVPLDTEIINIYSAGGSCEVR